MKKYDIQKEYINIDNYSPFCHINEVSKKYQKEPFWLPIIQVGDKKVPIHPDTFYDLNLKSNIIVSKIKVYPTASYRTVYLPSHNLFIKLPLLRTITRGLRNLPNRQLDMSKEANYLLQNLNIKGFNYLEEKPIYGKEEIYNYIIRKIKYDDIMPLFYVIKTKYFDKDTMFRLIKNMIDIWFELVSNNLYLEFHTQNILVDNNLNIYYRDLSDIRSIGNKILHPSYEDLTKSEINSLFFDKTFCSQNLDHIFHYYSEFDDSEKKSICNYIKQKINQYGIEFPNYSIIFPLDSQNRKPIKAEVIPYRV